MSQFSLTVTLTWTSSWSRRVLSCHVMSKVKSTQIKGGLAGRLEVFRSGPVLAVVSRPHVQASDCLQQAAMLTTTHSHITHQTHQTSFIIYSHITKSDLTHETHVSFMGIMWRSVSAECSMSKKHETWVPGVRTQELYSLKYQQNNGQRDWCPPQWFFPSPASKTKIKVPQRSVCTACSGCNNQQWAVTVQIQLNDPRNTALMAALLSTLYKRYKASLQCHSPVKVTHQRQTCHSVSLVSVTLTLAKRLVVPSLDVRCHNQNDNDFTFIQYSASVSVSVVISIV